MMSTFISTIIILFIISILFINSFDAVKQIGWQLFSLEWNPSKGEFGINSMLYGSFMVTFIALIIAVPLGLQTAIFTSEILAPRYRIYIKSILELLAGIPSIIYGLIGVALFSVFIGDIFNLQSGRGILTAGILLAVMILPTIITLTDDALHNVPTKYRETAQGLGLYKYEIIKDVIFPIVKSDIAGIILLGLGRALGETMAVMLVIGSIDKIPKPFYNILVPGQTITSKLGRELSESAFGSLHFSALIFMGLILLFIVLLLTTVTQYYFKQEQRLYE